jgi:phosphoribosylformimino-5-aminoimidazole carboxamide ribotide isomerase
MRIIPAIDIINGKCVRLTQGNYTQQSVYSENPIEVAKEFEAAGFRYLHLVDLDGASQGRVQNWNVLENICSQTSLLVDFGGGVKTEEEIEQAINAGAVQINLGSIAVNRPYRIHEWVEKFGAEKIIVSADVREGKIAINGWKQDSSIEVIPFLTGFVSQGLQYAACTDIKRDGMLNGPNFDLYKKLRVEFPLLNLIASGGVSSLEDVTKLKDAGVAGAIVGKSIYEKRINLKDLSELQ